MSGVEKAAEVTEALILPQPNGTMPAATPVEVVVTPTQVRRPWKATVRTVVQMSLALATLLPFVVSGVYSDVEAAPVAVGQVLAAAAAFTRVMALPQVEQFLQRFVPWLAAAPSVSRTLDGRF